MPRPDREDVAVDFVELRTDGGDLLPLERGSSEWGPYYRVAYQNFIPTNVQTLDITLSVQKMRTMEFLVKPTPLK